MLAMAQQPGIRLRRHRRHLCIPVLCAILASGAVRAAPAPDAGGAKEETLRLLSYNVRNLPESRFDERRPRILDVLERYDVALLQEDFAPRGIHDEWTAPVFRGPDAASRWYYLAAPAIRLAGYSVPYDAGLSALIAEDLAQRWHTEQILRAAYGRCHGILQHSHDCWANKGLLGVRLTAPSGNGVDLYVTHLDAGDHPGDRAARREQIDTMQQEIHEHSSGRAVVLAGDFNTRPRRTENFRAFMESMAALGLEDSGAGPVHEDGRQCRADYVFIHDGNETEIAVRDAREPEATYPGAAPQSVNFCDGEWRGRALSDHPAMAVTLELRDGDSNGP